MAVWKGSFAAVWLMQSSLENDPFGFLTLQGKQDAFPDHCAMTLMPGIQL